MIKAAVVTVILIILIQFIPLNRDNPKTDTSVALQANPQVMKILQKSCYDCHSNETKWSEYSYMAPLSFGVVSHVHNARKALNFSNYKNIPKNIKILRLKKAIHTLKIDTMPLPSYLFFHPEAHLTKDEKNILTKWFNSELEKIENTKTVSK